MDTDTRKLQKAFLDISNYIYVNDGVLKDRVFADVVRLISIKLITEQRKSAELLDFAYLQSIDKFDLDRWAKSLLDISITNGLESATNPIWNIKNESLHWAAIELSNFTFSNFPSDVKGEAFQALVVNNLRGDRGEYFTPEPLVSTLCKIVDLSKNTTVIDPACGSGGFLYGAYRSGVSPTNLFGSELSNDVGGAAQTRIQILGGFREQIRIGDAFRVTSEQYGTFDRVLMNPPFGSRTKIEDTKILSQFELPSRKYDTLTPPQAMAPELLFLELAIKLCIDGGIVGTVIPDGVLQNSSSKFVRDWLLTKANLLAVVSCPTVTFVPYGTGVKTSLLVLRKKSKKVISRPSFMAISKSVGYDPRGKTKYLNQISTPLEGLEGNSELKIDEDLTQIADEFSSVKFSEQRSIKIGNFVNIDESSRRWDAEFYQANDSKMLEMITGGNFPTLSLVCELKSEKLRHKDLAGEQRYVAIADLDSRTSQIVNIQNIEANDLPSRASYLANASDVITAIAGASTGTLKHASAIVNAENDGIIVSSGFALLRPKVINSYQLLGFLRSELFLRQAMRLRTGHAIPAISPTELMEIHVPPLNDPIWAIWAEDMIQLNEMAENLFKFSDSIRTTGFNY